MKKTIIVRAKDPERFLRILNMTTEAVMLLVEDIYRQYDLHIRINWYATTVGSPWCDHKDYHYVFMNVPTAFQMVDYQRLCVNDEFIKEPPTSEEIFFGEFRK